VADLLGFDVIVDDAGRRGKRYVAAKALITDDLDYPTRAASKRLRRHRVPTQGGHESIERALASEARYIALIASRKALRLVPPGGRRTMTIVV